MKKPIPVLPIKDEAFARKALSWKSIVLGVRFAGASVDLIDI
jgi:hypothetical protein